MKNFSTIEAGAVIPLRLAALAARHRHSLGVMRVQDDDLANWLRLQLSPGVGAVTARRLLQRFGLPAHIFSAEAAALREVVSAPLAQALAQGVAPEIARQIEQTLLWCAQPSNTVLTLADAQYPPMLLEIADPPLLLYIKGRLELLARPALAVVGSRNASAQGKINSEQFSHALSAAGLTIVSGLALGIDGAAHRGGLRGVGATIAVIGTGADLVYPRAHRDLAHLIAEQGCIVSEYALGWPALTANFPRRNRLISGLAQGVLVVEAAAHSGSLITARCAGEQGRDVFAIPGSIHAALSKGCHALIQQGAKLVESAQDVLQELGRGRPAASVRAAVMPEQHGLLTLLGYDPAAADTLAVRADMAVADVMAQLLTLELAGWVERLPGGMFQRCTLGQ